MRVEVMPKGVVKVIVGDKVYIIENEISNYTQITMLNLLSQRGCTYTYPCLQVKAVALYDPNKSLIKVLTSPSYSSGTSGGYFYVYSQFTDNSADSYTVSALKLFGLPTGWPDQQSNYYELARTTLSAQVQKPSTQTLTVAWGLGIKLSSTYTETGFLKGFTTPFENAIMNGYGSISGAYNIDIYDPNNNIIKTIGYSSISTGGGGTQPYTVTISFTDSTDASYTVQRARLFSATTEARYDIMNVYLSTPVSKGTSPATINLTISLPFAYNVTTTGIPSTYS